MLSGIGDCFCGRIELAPYDPTSKSVPHPLRQRRRRSGRCIVWATSLGPTCMHIDVLGDTHVEFWIVVWNIGGQHRVPEGMIDGDTCQ